MKGMQRARQSKAGKVQLEMTVAPSITAYVRTHLATLTTRAKDCLVLIPCFLIFPSPFPWMSMSRFTLLSSVTVTVTPRADGTGHDKRRERSHR